MFDRAIRIDLDEISRFTLSDNLKIWQSKDIRPKYNKLGLQ